MRSNRELLASISFEHTKEKHKKSLAKEVEEKSATENRLNGNKSNNTCKQDGAKHWQQEHSNLLSSVVSSHYDTTADEQARHTQRIIRCLKAALRKSIISISEPAKERPLDPSKDFMIESTMVFSAPHSGISCCGGSSTQVRHPRVTRLKPSIDPVNLIFGEDSDDDNNLRSNLTHYRKYEPVCQAHRANANRHYKMYSSNNNSNNNNNNNNCYKNGNNRSKQYYYDMHNWRSPSALTRSFAALRGNYNNSDNIVNNNNNNANNNDDNNNNANNKDNISIGNNANRNDNNWSRDINYGWSSPKSNNSRSRYRTQSFIMQEELQRERNGEEWQQWEKTEQEQQNSQMGYNKSFQRSRERHVPYYPRRRRRQRYCAPYETFDFDLTTNPATTLGDRVIHNNYNNNNNNNNNNNINSTYIDFNNISDDNNDNNNNNEQQEEDDKDDDFNGSYKTSSDPNSCGDEEGDEECNDDWEEVRKLTSFTFTDFAPMCYRHIREFLHINPKTYLDALMKSRWRSIPTPGKSNAQLFFCGRDWVIKSMKSSESQFLRDILHRYYYHVRDNPHTLLPHFTGHYRLQLGRQSFDFIIMKNVFATINPIDEKFDLKGSTIGRFATEKEKMRATCTQKDLDIHHPIHLSPSHRRMLMDQIKRDCDFLCRSKIIDYSLLVGVHIVRPNRRHRRNRARWTASNDNTLSNTIPNTLIPPQQQQQHEQEQQRSLSFADMEYGNNVITTTRETNRSVIINGLPIDSSVINRYEDCCFTVCEGGMPCNEIAGLRKEIYYIGIIDILQEYNTSKHLETLVRTIQYDGERISCVPPRKYAARFVAFMSSIII